MKKTFAIKIDCDTNISDFKVKKSKLKIFLQRRIHVRNGVIVE